MRKGAQYYRDKAERCRRLARAQSDTVWAGRLMGLADEYQAKADAIEPAVTSCAQSRLAEGPRW
jgi:hypothetical protein